MHAVTNKGPLLVKTLVNAGADLDSVNKARMIMA